MALHTNFDKKVSEERFYNFEKANFDAIGFALKSIHWQTFFTSCSDINAYWLKWCSYIMQLVHRFVPYTLRRKRGRPKLPNYVRNLLLRRNQAWRHYRLGYVFAL